MKKSLLRNAFLALFLVLGMAFWLTGCQDNSVGPETVPPSTPTNVVATAVDSTTVDISWTASTDNLVVCFYNVYRGLILAGTTQDTTFRDTGLTPGVTYAYTVVAIDCSQNPSTPSAPPDTASTPGTPPGGPALLKSGATFGIFSAAGITSTGPSVINGDVGMTPGTAYIGFSDSPSPGPGTHTGTLHINDGVAMQAKADFQTAYNDLFGRAYDVVSPGMTGTLTPAVYFFPSTAGLGTLVLNGAGIYIFQVGSSLTTASNSSVSLINGATADNVFWVMGQSATLGTNTAFQGTIIAQTSITLNTGATINDGRAAALVGAITLDNSTVTVP